MKTPGHLLIVDDEEPLREVLEMCLSDCVETVSTAIHGVDALEKIRSNKYHAVLSDINMPKMNGLELLRQVRADRNPIPFIILTAYGDKEKAVEALKNGAFDFLDKPWKEEVLLETVGRAIELGMNLQSWAGFPEQEKALIEIHNQSNQSSLEYLQKMLGVLSKENPALRKKSTITE